MRSIRVEVAIAVAIALAPPLVGADAPKQAITKDERAMLLGFDGRAKAVRLQAEKELREIAAEQREYVAGIAARLRLTPDQLANDYVIDMTTLAVTPVPKPKAGEAKKP